MTCGKCIDLGSDHWLTYFAWKPDRDIPSNAERFADFPDIEKAGAIVGHKTASGEECEGAVNFDVGQRAIMEPKRPLWAVESWEPLTISPSVLCTVCGDHGFIREGRWVLA